MKKLAMLLFLIGLGTSVVHVSAKEKIQPHDQSVYAGTTNAVVKLQETNGQIAEYPSSILDEQVVMSVPGHIQVRDVAFRWGETLSPGQASRCVGPKCTGDGIRRWTKFLNPKLNRLRIMHSQFVDTYLDCASKREEGLLGRHSVTYDTVDRDLTACSIRTLQEAADPGLFAIAAGVTKGELRKAFESGTLRLVILGSNAAEEIGRQFVTYEPLKVQCTDKFPKPSGKPGFAEQGFKDAVEDAKWNYKCAMYVAKGAAEKDRPFWMRWAEGRRRDLEAVEWRAKHLNPGGPNPIQDDGLGGGYIQGTCRGCMP